MSIAIIDYGSGNLRSVAKAFEHTAPHLNIRITALPTDVTDASHIVLPGVGAFGDCIKGLSAIVGMRDALEEAVLSRKKPFLGICVGMQMMLEEGHENGVHTGLGWIKGSVRKLPLSAPYKIPHMGWNTLRHHTSHPLLRNIPPSDHAYFVHSYYAQCSDVNDVIASTEYGIEIPAVIGRENMLGTQFHPEKSQSMGLRLIENFLQL